MTQPPTPPPTPPGPPWAYLPVVPPARAPTNTMAILALVLSLIIAPVGIVLGVIARSQIRQTGEEGDGLALAGIIIGAVSTGLAAIALILYIVFLSTIFGALSSILP